MDEQGRQAIRAFAGFLIIAGCGGAVALVVLILSTGA